MKTVIEMAREAGFDEFYSFDSLPLRLNRFAELVRADEREACAMVAEEHMREREGASFGIGAAIRARGNK